MKPSNLSLLLVFFSLTFLSAQEIQSPSFGNGILNLAGKDSSWTMKVATRMQLLTTVDWEKKTPNESDFLIRRARLKFDGFAYSPKLKYKIELGLSNRDLAGASSQTQNAPLLILDAMVNWNFSGNFELWFGQTKLPGNRERVISSGNMQLVDRSLLNSRFNIDRDLGVQLRHHFILSNDFVVREIFAVSQGEGRNISRKNLGGHQYTGRLEFLPFGTFSGSGDYSGSDLKREPKPKLAVGVSYDFNNNAVKDRSNLGSYMTNDVGYFETDISTLFVDAMYKHKGFSFMAEYADRTSDDPFAKNSDGTLTGDMVKVGKAINLQTGYLFTNNFELSGRYTNVKFDDKIFGDNGEKEYTVGVSKYLSGHKLKVQSDISYRDVVDDNSHIIYRLQFDIHF